MTLLRLTLALWLAVFAPILAIRAETFRTPFFEGTDAFDRSVALTQQPQRIASLAPSLTDLLLALDAGSNLVAVTQFCELPPGVPARPTIGGLADPNIEAIHELKIDLVVASTLTPRAVIDAIARTGLPVIAFEHDGLDGILADIRTLAALLGRSGEPPLAQSLANRLSSVRRQLADAPPVPTLMLFGLDGLFSAGPGTFPSEALAAAGGSNVVAGLPSAWPTLSMESVLAWNPAALVIGAGPGADARARSESAAQALADDPLWRRIRAVASNQVHLVDYSLLTVPGPRTFDLVEQLAHQLHPNRVPQPAPAP